MRLFSYKLAHDAGFAPNPFWGYLSLATCKPGMRRTKRMGDWIAGFTSGQLNRDPVGGERLIFLMQVTEPPLKFADYFRDPRFAEKVPSRQSDDYSACLGDNIYEPLTSEAVEHNQFRRTPNPSHNLDNMAEDLSGLNVLVSSRFVYFGRGAIQLPPEFRPDVPRGQSNAGQGTHDPDRVAALVKWIETRYGIDANVVDLPHSWDRGLAAWTVRKGTCGDCETSSNPGCPPSSKRDQKSKTKVC